MQLKKKTSVNKEPFMLISAILPIGNAENVTSRPTCGYIMNCGQAFIHRTDMSMIKLKHLKKS